jgi:hypothetical protein
LKLILLFRLIKKESLKENLNFENRNQSNTIQNQSFERKKGERVQKKNLRLLDRGQTPSGMEGRMPDSSKSSTHTSYLEIITFSLGSNDVVYEFAMKIIVPKVNINLSHKI